MPPQQNKHYALQVGYYVSLLLAVAGGLITFLISLYAIKLSITQKYTELQWGGGIIFVFLAGIPSLLIGALNLKLDRLLKEAGAYDSIALKYGKKLLICLLVATSIAVSVCFAISIFRLDVAKR